MADRGKQVIHNINYFGDKCACGWYRLGWPSNIIQTIIGTEYHYLSTDTELLIGDPNFYRQYGGPRLVRIQRWFGYDKLTFLRDFLKPLSEALGFTIAYEVDDVLVYDDIPKYNIAKPAFHPDRVGDTVKEIFQLCDLITVSTDELRDFYMKRFSMPKDKFFVINNYLPRWWIGDAMDIDRQMLQYSKQRNKPTIAFCCSANHFDLDNLNDGVDDFTHIIPWIISNMHRYNFTFVGGIPQQLSHFAYNGQIQVQSPSDIFNYPSEMKKRKIDLLLAPLMDNEFNRCKSNIKFLEFSALGIPMAGQNISTYNKYTKLVFNDGQDLDRICNQLFFEKDSEEYYRNVIQQQRNIIDYPSPISPNGFWLEKNYSRYYELFTLPQKTIQIDINNVR
jgi:hypothetical protein